MGDEASRIDHLLFEKIGRLEIEVERIEHESNQFTLEAKSLDQLAIRLQARAALLQARAVALRRLHDELSEMAPANEAPLTSGENNAP